MTEPSICLCCGRGPVRVLVDFGLQPPSNGFERPDDLPHDEAHPLIVGQCAACSLVQLIRPMPPAMVRTRFAWLTYNEPEGHLDDLVARLCRLPGIGRDSRIIGLTYKDDSTLARFNRLGYANTFRYETSADLELQDPCAGIESVQASLDETLASRLAVRHGVADVLIVRHVLEHAHCPAAFLRAAATLVKPGSYLVFEMPDCTKFIQACDYSFIWEEHIVYFSSQTLAAFVRNAGFAMHETVLYTYRLEDSLIGIVRNDGPVDAWRPARDEVDAALADGRAFGQRFSEFRIRLQTLFRTWQQEGKRVAVFGAGHLAARFVNFFLLADFLDCVIDDDPHKRALLMPGSRLPVFGSAALDSRAINLCLLSLSPESEHKVLTKNQAFLDRGGRFLSIFAQSPQAVYRVCAP